MAEVAKKYADRLDEIKESVEQSREYFQDNVDRYHEFMKFVFKTSMTEEDLAALNELGKPTIEFNIVEALVSRLRGEFAKQQPGLTVRAADGVPTQMLTKEYTQQLEVIEGHLRAVFFDASNDKLEYNVYTDGLAGGYSAMRVFTDYVNEMSFEQNINVERVFDPTLCGWDPMARESHKGDGQYCFELSPMTRKEFEDDYGSKVTERMKFTRDLAGFGWSYKNSKEDVILVCDFYEKKRKRVKIIKLTNGHTVLESKYKEFLELWEAESFLEQPPLPVGEPRWTHLETICRYRLCESEVLEYTETNFKHLPIVFVDGNSVMLNEGTTQSQMTRPYVYHAKGIQQLKNFAGQSLANELENLIQHKFVVAIESIPEDYISAYQNVQKADTLIYNHFMDKSDTSVTLPPPREVQRTPIPPQIAETFRMSDEMTQTILGTYDNATGQNNNHLSGVAMARGAMNSNNASVPYIVGYIKGLNRVAQIIVDLIPKYYLTPRSMPVLLPSGKREYVVINKKGPNSLYMNYDPNTIQVKVETGVNFAIQKEIALQTITSMMQASTSFADFINQYGLEVLLDNIEIRGIDSLKVKAEEYSKTIEQKQQQQQQIQQQQMQMQNKMAQINMAKAEKELQSPTAGQLGAAKLQQDAQKNEFDAKVDYAELHIKERKAEDDFLKVMADINSSEIDAELKQAKVDAEQTRSAVEMAISTSKHITEMTKLNDKPTELSNEE